MARLVPFPPPGRPPAASPAKPQRRRPEPEVRRWQEIVERLRAQGGLPPAGIPTR